jgi:ABC-2 type transport system permease protein
VSFQTVAAPVLTAILYLMIFGHVLEDHVKVYDTISYTAFLIPGLVMMSLLQNSFANTSSSLIQSKITGNLIFVLLAPLSHFEFFSAYVLAAMVRGIAVGAGVFLATCWFTDMSFVHPLWVIIFGLLSAALLAVFGQKSLISSRHFRISSSCLRRCYPEFFIRFTACHRFGKPFLISIHSST